MGSSGTHAGDVKTIATLLDPGEIDQRVKKEGERDTIEVTF